MDVARLNFSHGNLELHAENAQRVRAAAGKVGRQVAILQDLPGPKLRIGALHDERAELKPGERLVLVAGSDVIGTAEQMSVTWPGFAASVDPDDVIYLADGAIRLRVTDVRAGDGEVETAVEIGGVGRLAPGAEHPRLDARARGGPGGGSGDAALRRVDRGRRRRAVVRAHRRGRDHRPRAHPPAAGGQDREAAGRRGRRGDHPRRRRRDGGPGRSRHRAADRGRADGPEGACCGSPDGSRARRSPLRRCSTRWSPPRAPPEPRWPTWPTRSSTAPTP